MIKNSIAKSRREFLKAGTALGLGSLALHRPLKAQPTYQWKMVTTWPKNFPGLGTGAENLAKRISTLSQGRIQVRVFGAGELVPATGVFDAVSRGTAELGHGAPYYWKGKHPATSFFAAIPFGLNAMEMTAWIKFGGAQKLWDELYSSFGVLGRSSGSTGAQMGGWFKRPINSIADFKGLKMRIPGLGGDVLRNLGVTVVQLSGGEIFQALQTGNIDATEWVGPYNDLAFGLQQVSKLYYGPGWHEPGTIIECLMNKKAFESLPKDLQAVVHAACDAASDDMISEFTFRNSLALETLVSKHQVQVKEFSPEILKKLSEVSKQVIDGLAAADPFTKKVFESFLQFRKQAMSWSKVGEESLAKARFVNWTH